MENDEPELVFLPDHDYDGTIELLEELGQMPVEAMILDISNGESMRKFQQALIPVGSGDLLKGKSILQLTPYLLASKYPPV